MVVQVEGVLIMVILIFLLYLQTTLVEVVILLQYLLLKEIMVGLDNQVPLTQVQVAVVLQQ
jgi:hypothetical protein